MEINVGLLLLIAASIVVLRSYYIKPPKRDLIDTSELPKSYIIEKANRMDHQQNNECAAFSSAYILRHLGEDADGHELYRRFPRKQVNGTVDPNGIVVLFRRLGFRAAFYRGNVNTLKKRLVQGIPVIVFIRAFPGKRYLHFATVVGYDDEYMYMVDSLPNMINCSEMHYNRRVLIRDFEVVWKTWALFCTNSYIVISPNSSHDRSAEQKHTVQI